MQVQRVEPEGSGPVVAWRRLGEAPSLWLPLVVFAAAVGCRFAAWVRPDEDLPVATRFATVCATIAALLIRAVRGPWSPGTPSDSLDSAEPIPVRWLEAPKGLGSPRWERPAHLTPTAIRIAWTATYFPDRLLLFACAIAGGIAFEELYGFFPVLSLAWAFGLPRPARFTVEIPWEAIDRVDREGRTRYRIARSGEPDLVLETTPWKSPAMADGLSARLGGRFHGEGASMPQDALPAVLRPVQGDDEAGVAELAVRRLGWRHLGALACLLIAGALLAAARLAGIPGLQLSAGAMVLVAVVLSLFGARGRRQLWRGGTPEPGDTPDPISVAWIGRPGWPGPRPQQAHIRPEALRVVAHEWELWDILVVGAAGLAALPVGGFIAAAAAITVFQAAGLPRWRRVAVDLPWEEITDVEIVARGGTFQIRTSLAPPADRLRLNAKFSARERLTGALRERLGDRVRVEAPANRA